jgi:hypothetical protein
VATSPTHAYEGGCLCGAIRFASSVAPTWSGYCHCRLCQRSSGSPVLAWASFPLTAFAYLAGKPSIFHSSSHGQREFCGHCGSQLAFRENAGATSIYVNIATLDRPEAVEPRCHIWSQSRIRWFETTDALPRYDDEGPPESVG